MATDHAGQADVKMLISDLAEKIGKATNVPLLSFIFYLLSLFVSIRVVSWFPMCIRVQIRLSFPPFPSPLARSKPCP